MVQLPLFDPVELPLTKGYVALIDPIDSDLLQSKWTANPRHDGKGVYAQRTAYTNGTYVLVQLHRVIYERIVGRSLNRSELIDHWDLNPLNNQRSNLRLATHAQNQQNRHKKPNTKSGYKGVSWHSHGGHWVAVISVDGKPIRLGSFKDPHDAHLAYCAAATKYYGEYARFE